MKDRELFVCQVLNGGCLMSVPLLVLWEKNFEKAGLLFLASLLLCLVSQRKKSILAYLAALGLLCFAAPFFGEGMLEKTGLLGGLLLGGLGYAAGRWKGKGGCFGGPSLTVLVITPFWYISGMVMERESLKNGACLFAAVCWVLCLLYENRKRFLSYAKENRSLNRFPGKRLERRNRVNVAFMAGFVAAAMLLGYWAAPGDPSFSEMGPVELSEEGPMEWEQPAQRIEPGEWLPMEKGEPPKWLVKVEAVLYRAMQFLMGAAALIGLGYGIYKLVSGYRSGFGREEKKEKQTEEDKIERVKAKHLSFGFGWERRSEAQKIRRYYKRWIQSRAAKQPRPSASPAEVEAEAGVCDEEIHRIYEKARYGKGECTREESGIVKRRIP